jgi:UDP-N-acetyl-D-glucosamine dehydrogenase
MNGSHILVLGVAYKQDIDDYRESPAIRVIEELEKEGADVKFYDPYISKYSERGNIKEGEKELTVELINNSDLIIITAAHTNVDYKFVQQHAKVIFDTKNVMKNIEDKSNIELL